MRSQSAYSRSLDSIVKLKYDDAMREIQTYVYYLLHFFSLLFSTNNNNHVNKMEIG